MGDTRTTKSNAVTAFGVHLLVPKGRQVLLHQQVERFDGLVLWRVRGALARLDALDHVIWVDVVEKCHRLAATGAASIKRRRHNTMQRGNPSIVGPASHEVTQIDDVSVRQVRHIEPILALR
jgi:hypothetical protein